MFPGSNCLQGVLFDRISTRLLLHCTLGFINFCMVIRLSVLVQLVFALCIAVVIMSLTVAMCVNQTYVDVEQV